MGGTKGKKKVKQGKGSEKKNATKKKVNKTTASGSSDGDSSAESSAPEEGMCFLRECGGGFDGGLPYKSTSFLISPLKASPKTQNVYLFYSSHKLFSHHVR